MVGETLSESYEPEPTPVLVPVVAVENMTVYIEGAQPQVSANIPGTVRHLFDQEPDNPAFYGYNSALAYLSNFNKIHGQNISNGQLIHLIDLAAQRAFDGLEIDPSKEKLKLPSQFYDLDPEVLNAISEYFETDPFKS